MIENLRIESNEKTSSIFITIHDKKYTVGRTLGHGTFAVVKIGVAEDGTQWAIKEIDTSKSVIPDIAL